MREGEDGQDESGGGTDGETEERRLSRPKESKPLGRLLVGLGRPDRLRTCKDS